MKTFNKIQMIAKLESVKEKALEFIAQDHSRWNRRDPLGLADKLIEAQNLVHGVDYLIAEIEFLDDDAQFEYLAKGEFERLDSLSNLIRREDLKKVRSTLKCLYPSLEHMDVFYNEPSYKMGELSVFEAPSVYVIYTAKIWSNQVTTCWWPDFFLKFSNILEKNTEIM